MENCEPVGNVNCAPVEDVRFETDEESQTV